MLREDYKDDIFAGARKYKMITNTDGTVSFVDMTDYTQEGDVLGAEDVNNITRKVNENAENLKDHEQSASTITEGTLAGAVVANATAVADLTMKQTRNIYAGTDDMTAGTTELASGDIYVMYE